MDIVDVIESFPAVFGLRGFSGRFRISVDSLGRKLTIQTMQFGEWLDFSRCTPEELRAEIVEY